MQLEVVERAQMRESTVGLLRKRPDDLTVALQNKSAEVESLRARAQNSRCCKQFATHASGSVDEAGASDELRDVDPRLRLLRVYLLPRGSSLPVAGGGRWMPTSARALVLFLP